MHLGRGCFLLVLCLVCVCVPVRGRRSNTEEYPRASNSTDSGQRESFLPKDIQVECQELRAKRYISDGYCTSRKPINEVVCTGNCLPIRELPWFAEFVKYWSRKKLREFQCEEDVVKRKKVNLLCQNGEYRTYKIKVVKSCKCKRIVDEHNRTRKEERRRKRRKQRNRGEKENVQHEQKQQQQQQQQQPQQQKTQQERHHRDTNV